MKPRGAVALLVTLPLIFGGCATSAAGGGGNLDRLTAEQIQAALQSVDEPLYPVIVRTRPQWLIARTGRPGAVVFMDGIETGPIETLQTVAARRVERAAYVSPEDTAARFGSAFEGGIIEVTLRRR
jgi:hypothetical protein